MGFKKNINDLFVYIHYVRENEKDFNKYKRELENMFSVSLGNRDCVVDLSDSTCITSSEIGLLVRLLNHFKGTARFLRIVSNHQINQILRSTNLDKLENLYIFDTREEFVKQLKQVTKK